MPLNILQCHNDCKLCVLSYKQKHKLKKGDTFDIVCNGIPKNYVNKAATAQLQSPFDAEILLDPVKWAAEVLDWHCLDPDGAIWKRKNPEEYYSLTERYPGRPSKYHRPYQATMLRCTAKRKVFRIGRQAGKTETLIISMLFHLFVNDNFKIVLITPYQSQIDLIFKRVEELIQSNPALQNSVKRSVKAPQYTIELYNGSQIKGFTAGTKSGGGAGAARGQSANMLVFDEADYLNPDDMDAAMSIITNFPDATVWMSSTPSGKREKFYEACLSRDWKEYHYASSVNPNWNDELEKLFRTQLTKIGYTHEVEAEFGSQEEGVFQVSYVEAAQAEYTYEQMKPSHEWMYSIGVDWNSIKYGTTICVTGFNPTQNKFMVVERAVVQRAGWTQLEACQKIVELNRKWKPFAIYVDKGYGATQIEVLHKFGYDARVDPERGKNHVDSRLPQIVKSFDFGGTIETRDPFTKQKIKKPAKGFLVENTVRRFEAGDIFYPKSDTILTNELLNYIVKNVTQAGHMVYGVNNEAIGDHNLDAFMLSLVGFTLEKTPFGNPARNERIGFTTSRPENEEEFLIPLKREKTVTRKELINNMAPDAGRADFDNRSNTWSDGQQLPAANVNPAHQSQPKLWDYPGWSVDAPPPKLTRPRTINRGNVLSRGAPPKRNHF